MMHQMPSVVRVPAGWRTKLTAGRVERWGAVAAGALLVAYGVSRWRASSTNTRVALAQDKGVDVRESVRIQKPVDEMYQLWRRLENLPRFMSNLISVTEMPDGRSHWVAKSAAGRTVEWDAEIINEVTNKVIGWRSLPDADVVSAGSVNFRPVRNGRGTQLTIHLQYAPPLGRLGATAAMLFGAEPSQMIREDLRRFKQQLEAGEIPRSTPETSSRGRI
jgi:uncharacterized membrane protein